MTKETIAEYGRVFFMYWVNHPEKENYIFNESESILDHMSFCYAKLLILGAIKPLEQLPEEKKIELKAEAKRIDPMASVEKGMKICKTIYVFGWLSNN